MTCNDETTASTHLDNNSTTIEQNEEKALRNSSYTTRTKFETDIDDDEDIVSFTDEILEYASNRQSVESSLTDRSQTISSIQWLSRHLPRCVLLRLSKDVISWMHSRDIIQSVGSSSQSQHLDELMKVPHGTRHHVALLFIDISGFTKLSQKLDVEMFSRVRSYLRRKLWLDLIFF